MVAPASLRFTSRASGLVTAALTEKRLEVEVRYPFRELKEGDRVLRLDYGDMDEARQSNAWTSPDAVWVERYVPLTEDEAALVQATLNYREATA